MVMSLTDKVLGLMEITAHSEVEEVSRGQSSRVLIRI